ncbi:MAG: TlpA disulfide reductase family protein [Azospirillaceae bacterium]
MNRRTFVTTLAGAPCLLPLQASAQRAPLYDMRELVSDMAPIDLAPLNLTTLEGEDEPFTAHQGSLVILNIWATWCSPCIWELPSLGRLADAFVDQGLRVIAASIDGDGIDAVRTFLTRQPVDGPVFRHMGADGQEMLPVIASLPVTFIVLPDMRAVARVDQPIQWDTPEVRRRVTRWLDQHVAR